MSSHPILLNTCIYPFVTTRCVLFPLFINLLNPLSIQKNWMSYFQTPHLSRFHYFLENFENGNIEIGEFITWVHPIFQRYFCFTMGYFHTRGSIIVHSPLVSMVTDPSRWPRTCSTPTTNIGAKAHPGAFVDADVYHIIHGHSMTRSMCTADISRHI